jgi:hypothetical protein
VVFCLPYSSIMKMEVISSFETSIDFQRYIPEDKSSSELHVFYEVEIVFFILFRAASCFKVLSNDCSPSGL